MSNFSMSKPALNDFSSGHSNSWFSNFEFPLMTKGGIRLEVLLNATTRKDEQGNIIGK